MSRLLLLAALGACLAGCGMNRAVAVLPNTLDDLGRRTEPLREGRQPGDEALAAAR
ncbi:hypothetical protein [Aureimonas ureilytica]|uniref:hypothetical protein n=1 Tax=Aureimonas ureilytica TaxID=401562 RepID=UPI00036366AA|nr:hypothetical protein [Aureimonas ureilytica]